MEFESQFTDVSPVHPAASYIGGKRRLAKQLVAMIAAVPHRTYCEAFVGMGGVFFRRTKAHPAAMADQWGGLLQPELLQAAE